MTTTLLLVSSLAASTQNYAEQLKQFCPTTPSELVDYLLDLSSRAERMTIEASLQESSEGRRARTLDIIYKSISKNNCQNEIYQWLKNEEQRLLQLSYISECNALAHTLENLCEKSQYSQQDRTALTSQTERLQEYAQKAKQPISQFFDLNKTSSVLNRINQEELSSLEQEIRRLAPFSAPKQLIQQYQALAQEYSIPSNFNAQEVAELLERGQNFSEQRQRSCSVKVNFNSTVHLNNARNQHDIGWCYAFVAADLISHRIGQQVSALDVVDAYYYPGTIRKVFNPPKQYYTEQEAGSIYSAIKKATRRGFCLEFDLPTDNLNLLAEEQNYLHALRSIELAHQTYQQSGILLTNSCDHGEFSQQCQQIFPYLDLGDITDVIRHEKSKPQIIHSLIEKNCQQKRIKPPLPPLHFMKKPFPQLISQIDQLLDNEQIIAISYNLALLSDHTAQTSPDQQSHASTIVGRRFINGQCQYLIRNSYGNSCNDIDPIYTCQNGHIWIPEAYLLKNLQQITYFE